FALAASALELAPDVPELWIALARHCVYERAAIEREADPSARRHWVQAAFDALERGAPTADARGALSLERGNLLAYLALVAALPEVPESEQPWPGRPSALFEDAARAYDRAAALGDLEAADLARGTRERAAEARARDE
ncbi:MAG: hypothetical protein HZA53_14230, partial [Planctomycetes bacterium]|nr:hypothetical protein [Planctomycetota bacterium]